MQVKWQVRLMMRGPGHVYALGIIVYDDTAKG
jgi:hypothetical protein